jgi:hypothetical protein
VTAVLRDAAAAAVLGEVAGRAAMGSAAFRPREVALGLAAGVVVAAVALDGGVATAGRAALRAAAVGLAAAALVALHRVGRPLDAARLGIAAASLALAATGAIRLAAALLGSADRGRLAAILGLALAGAAPVWLGPAVERLAAPEAAAGALVAASPLTFLAVMGGVDYLHLPWFYAWSPIASLRFAYPTGAVLTAGHLAVGVLLLHAARALPERWRRG